MVACSRPAPTFSCEDTAQCGAGGVCEATGLCSFVDAECASGRRYSEHSGELSNTCVGGAAPGDAPPDMQDCPDDLDCDTVLDAVDNCPRTANENQFNEDDDATGDACDLCPPFEDTGEDSDGDGVGNNCDPHPNQADTLVEFVGFNEMPAGWSAMGGTFALDGGDGVLTGNANVAARLMRATPAVKHYTMWVEATLESISPAALGAMGVGVRHAPGSDDLGGLCQLVGNANGTGEELRLFDTGNGGAVLLDSIAHGTGPGETYELYLEDDDGLLSCDTTSPDAFLDGMTMFDPPNRELGIRVRSATARYHWAMVLTTN